jgi:hypothetical protein
MAVALAMPPDALLRADDEVFDHLIVLAQRERTMKMWSAEVAAVTAELVHALYRVTVQVNSKSGRGPEALRIPRPWVEKPRGRHMTLTDFARKLTGRG